MSDSSGPGNLVITVLGSGTSAGVPMIGCECDVCTSADPHDNRLRPSIMVQFADRVILVDTTPDFRVQALRAKIPRIDAILFTHAHADHIMGLDDVRPYNYRQKSIIPIYGNPETLDTVRQAFSYIFAEKNYSTFIPKLEARVVDDTPFDIYGLPIQPIRLQHGPAGTVYGYRFGPAAYLTDHSDIPAASLEKLKGLDVLFLDALRYKPHPTHSTVEDSLKTVELLQPRRAYFTHLSHDIAHARAEARFPENVRLAYDGLQITVELPN